MIVPVRAILVGDFSGFFRTFFKLIWFICLMQGERLSHAVGCAFAVCLERKQKRDKECSVTMNFDTSNSTFTRTGSFRQAPLTERIHDPQDCKPPAGNFQSVCLPRVRFSRRSMMTIGSVRIKGSIRKDQSLDLLKDQRVLTGTRLDNWLDSSLGFTDEGFLFPLTKFLMTIQL